MRQDQLAEAPQSVFAADEPVIQTHPVLEDTVILPFGETTVWDFNGVLRRPANLVPSAWKLSFSKELAQPSWNLLARELRMVELNPRHPAITAVGLSRSPQPASLTSVAGRLGHLRVLARWMHEQQLPTLQSCREQDLPGLSDP